MPQRNGAGATELPTPAPGRDLRAAHHRILFWVMLIALILRIAGLIAEPKVIENEGAEYARIAYNIRNGHGYIGTMSGSELLFPPLYPVLIAGVSFVTGNLELAARVINLLAGTLLVMAIFLIAEALYGRRVAILSALVVAFYPLLIALSASTYSECLYITLMIGGLYQGLAWQKTKRVTNALLAGVFLGLAYLTRPEALPYSLTLATLVVTISVIEGEALHRRFSEWRWRLVFVARSVLLAAICMVVTHLTLPKTLTYSVGLIIMIVITVVMERENWNPVLLQAGCMLLVVAVLALPYVAFLRLHTGQIRLQGKSEVNYVIAERLNSGLDPNEASWGLNQNGGPEGPLLNPNRYIGSRPYPHDLRAMLHSLLVSARRNQYALRHLPFFPFLFWPLFLTALAASFQYSWNRERLARETLLICFFVLACLPLIIVPVFSLGRILLPLLPLVLLWSSKGIEELSGQAQLLGSKFLIPEARLRTIGGVITVGLATLLVYCGARGLTYFPDLVPTDRELDMKQAGLYLGSQVPGPKRIMDTGTIVSYYSGGTWVPMPWAAGRPLLNYVAREKPDLVVVHADTWNPGAIELIHLLDEDRRAHFVRQFSSNASDQLRVYAWSN